MPKIITLQVVHFDGLENHEAAAIRIEETHVFVDTAEKTASCKIQEFLNSRPPVKLYYGWNGGIYPEHRVKTSYAH